MMPPGAGLYCLTLRRNIAAKNNPSGGLMKQVDLSSTRVARYVLEQGTRESAAMAKLREETSTMREAHLQISADQGQLLAFMARVIGARQALEVGTFTGYSALAIAEALPADGQLITCDINEEYTEVARRYWREAGVQDRIQLRLAPALETLQGLLADGYARCFDLVFVDADKAGYDDYYEHGLKLLRPGGVMLLDNVLWGGAVADPDHEDADTAALAALNTKLQGDDRIDMCLAPIGDGLGMVRRRA
jgi:predicted O-methyltransferase YrrM